MLVLVMLLLQEMEHRYQDFRQYVATAIDCEETCTLSHLAQRYQKAATRMQQHQQRQPQAATVAGPAPVEGAVHSFEALAVECKQCASCPTTSSFSHSIRNVAYARTSNDSHA
jgi:hypothetical protein